MEEVISSKLKDKNKSISFINKYKLLKGFNDDNDNDEELNEQKVKKENKQNINDSEKEI
jgi:hypothetical protein